MANNYKNKNKDDFFDQFLNDLLAASLENQGPLSIIDFANQIIFNNDPLTELYPTQRALLKAFYNEQLDEDERTILESWSKEDKTSWVDNRKYISLIWQCGRRGSKALSLNTPIETPEGTKLFKDIHTGDYVFNPQGELVQVLGETPIYTDHKIYRLHFDDESYIECDAEHLWETWDLHSKKSYGRYKKDNIRTAQVRSTQEIVDTLYKRKSSGKLEFNHSINLCKPLKHKRIKTVMHPWVLGFWLTNETESTNELIVRFEIVNFIKDKLIKLGYDVTTKSTKYKKHSIKSERLQKELKNLGLTKKDSIPYGYLNNSLSQRLHFLKGLMDGGGAICSKNKAYISNTNKVLTNAIHNLANSLGCFTTVENMVNKYNEDYEIIRFHSSFIPFSIPPKVSKYSTKYIQHTCRHIVKAELIPSVPVKCIKVEGELFLIGNNITTHNCFDLNATINTTKGDLPAYKLHTLLQQGEKIGINTYSGIKNKKGEGTLGPKEKYITYDIKTEINKLGKLYEVTTENNRQEITNEEHPYLVWRNNKPEWIPLKKLKKGEWVATNPSTNLYGEETLSDELLRLIVLDYSFINKKTVSNFINNTYYLKKHNIVNLNKEDFLSKYIPTYIKNKDYYIEKEEYISIINSSWINKLDEIAESTLINLNKQDLHKLLNYFILFNNEFNYPTGYDIVLFKVKSEYLNLIQKLFLRLGINIIGEKHPKLLKYVNIKIQLRDASYKNYYKFFNVINEHIVSVSDSYHFYNKPKTTYGSDIKFPDVLKQEILYNLIFNKKYYKSNLNIFFEAVHPAKRLLLDCAWVNQKIWEYVNNYINCKYKKERIPFINNEIVNKKFFTEPLTIKPFQINQIEMIRHNYDLYLLLYSKNMNWVHKHTLLNYAYDKKDTELIYWANSDIVWSKIKKIKSRNTKPVVSIEVKDTNIIANQLITHNSTLASIIVLKEFYDLIILDNPQRHYGLIPNSPIALLVMAQSQAQVKETIFSAIRGYAEGSNYFKSLESQGIIEILSEEIRCRSKNISIYAKHTNSKSLVGYTIKAMILDEVARFETIGESEKNKAFEIWENVACHKDDNLIYIDKGAITFKALLSAEEKPAILTYDLKTGKSYYTNNYKVFDNGVKKVTKVVTSSNRVTEITKEHPLLVWNPNDINPKWVECKDLKVNDWVAISTTACVSKHEQINIEYILNNPALPFDIISLWVNNDITWDYIVSIKEIGNYNTVGMTVHETNIIGNSFISHNTGGSAFGSSFRKIAISSAWEPGDPMEVFLNKAKNDPSALSFNLTTFEVNLSLKKNVTPVIVSDYLQDYVKARREYENIRFNKFNSFILKTTLEKYATGISAIDSNPSIIDLKTNNGINYYVGIDITRMAPLTETNYRSFIHVDPALKKDSAALALAHPVFNENKWKIQIDALIKWEPRTDEKGLKRIVSFIDIEEKLYSICDTRKVMRVTMDQYNSASLLQNLQARGVDAQLVSCTREMQFTYYTNFRDLLNHGYIILPKDSLWSAEAITEISELVLKSNKQIIHPNAGKDLADAIVNVVFQCYQYMAKAGLNLTTGLNTTIIKNNKINLLQANSSSSSKLIIGAAIDKLNKY